MPGHCSCEGSYSKSYMLAYAHNKEPSRKMGRPSPRKGPKKGKVGVKPQSGSPDLQEQEDYPQRGPTDWDQAPSGEQPSLDGASPCTASGKPVPGGNGPDGGYEMDFGTVYEHRNMEYDKCKQKMKWKYKCGTGKFKQEFGDTIRIYSSCCTDDFTMKEISPRGIIKYLCCGGIQEINANGHIRNISCAGDRAEVAPPGISEATPMHQVTGVIQASNIAAGHAPETASDRRVKRKVKNLSDIYESALDIIKNLRPVKFRWKSGSKRGQDDIGFIAQEVEELFPDVVNTRNKEGNKFKSINYEKFVPLLVQSIQEMSSEIDALKAEIKEIKNA